MCVLYGVLDDALCHHRPYWPRIPYYAAVVPGMRIRQHLQTHKSGLCILRLFVYGVNTRSDLPGPDSPLYCSVSRNITEYIYSDWLTSGMWQITLAWTIASSFDQSQPVQIFGIQKLYLSPFTNHRPYPGRSCVVIGEANPAPATLWRVNWRFKYYRSVTIIHFNFPVSVSKNRDYAHSRRTLSAG